MSDIFKIKKNDSIEVRISYLPLDEGEIQIIRDDDTALEEKYKGKIQKAVAQFRVPNWKEFNGYISGCLRLDEDTGLQFLDSLKLRDKKLRSLLKTLKDGDGNDVPLNSDFFDSIIPEFGVALVVGFDNAMVDQRIQRLKEKGLIDTDFVNSEIVAEIPEDSNS